MKLNHIANRIVSGKLEFVIELFTTQLGCIVLRKIPTDVWLRQPDANIDIQFCETNSSPDENDKHNSHVAFLSATPEVDLKNLAQWIESKGYATKIGNWSEKEWHLDVPEVFVDFCIEAMNPELADYEI